MKDIFGNPSCFSFFFSPSLLKAAFATGLNFYCYEQFLRACTVYYSTNVPWMDLCWWYEICMRFSRTHCVKFNQNQAKMFYCWLGTIILPFCFLICKWGKLIWKPGIIKRRRAVWLLTATRQFVFVPFPCLPGMGVRICSTLVVRSQTGKLLVTS